MDTKADMTIPAHLSHLPRLGGMPIPAVTCNHTNGRNVLSLSEWPGYDLQVDFEGTDGPPDFAKYDDRKLRHCMVQGLCHVCWTKPKYPLVCVPGEPQRCLVGGKPATLIAQPWVCAPCLGYSVQTCPPLMRAIEAGRGLVLSITKYRLVGTGWKPANEGDPIPPEGASVLSYFKILPFTAAVQSLPDWCAGAGRKYR